MLCQQAILEKTYATMILPSRRYADCGFIKCDLHIDTACADPGGSTLVEGVSPVRSHLSVLLILLAPVTQTGIVDDHNGLERRERMTGLNYLPVDRCK